MGVSHQWKVASQLEWKRRKQSSYVTEQDVLMFGSGGCEDVLTWGKRSDEVVVGKKTGSWFVGKHCRYLNNTANFQK